MIILAQTSTEVTTAVLFYLFAAMSAGAAVAMVLSRNIVRTAVALLFTLLGVGGLYFLLDAEFLAAVQLVALGVANHEETRQALLAASTPAEFFDRLRSEH